ncbi:undecaprenyl-diphosphate phosphatase, partial [Candidatus Parcubacteria bacterium]|nr:undecaprenyl-diphosphate phosphatase [Candidatus Parcubacteria bacterium]
MLEYFILGILQGIFEWIPISSEAIGALTSKIFVKNYNPVDVALFLHLGTTLACIFYFWRDIKEILFLKNKKLFEFLAISTIVSLMVGFFLYKAIKKMAFGNYLLIIIGFGFLLTAFFHKKKKNLKIKEIKLAIFSG